MQGHCTPRRWMLHDAGATTAGEHELLAQNQRDLPSIGVEVCVKMIIMSPNDEMQFAYSTASSSRHAPLPKPSPQALSHGKRKRNCQRRHLFLPLPCMLRDPFGREIPRPVRIVDRLYRRRLGARYTVRLVETDVNAAETCPGNRISSRQQGKEVYSLRQVSRQSFECLETRFFNRLA